MKSILPLKRTIDKGLKGVGGNFAVLCENPQRGGRREHKRLGIEITIISKELYEDRVRKERGGWEKVVRRFSLSVNAISDKLPQGCAALINHAYTDYSDSGLRYVGLPVPDYPTTIWVDTDEDVRNLAAQYAAGHWVD